MKKMIYLKGMVAGAICMFLSTTDALAYDFSGGSGTSRDPYQIKTIQDFDSIRTARDKKFILMNDLDFAGYTQENGDPWWPIGEWGEGDHSAARFSGTFDGNGFTIKNLTADRICHDMSLFGVTDGATITKLILENFDLSAEARTGALIGTAFGTEVQQCGAINIKINGIHGPKVKIGGLIGWAQIGTAVRDCYTSGTVYSQGDEAGGICGALISGSTAVVNCYSSCLVESDNHTGSIVGASDAAPISNCVAISSEINCAVDAARICSILHNGGEIINCYAYDGLKINGNVVTEGLGAGTLNGANATEAQLKSVDFYDDLEFAIKPGDAENPQIWKIDPVISPYPVFVWQTGTSGIAPNAVAPYHVWMNGDQLMINGLSGNEQINVYSVTGQLVNQLVASKAVETVEISQSGVYMIQIIAGKQTSTFKVAK